MPDFIAEITNKLFRSGRDDAESPQSSVQNLNLAPIHLEAETLEWIESYRDSSGINPIFDDKDMLLRAYMKYIGNLEGVRHYFVSGNYDADWILSLLDKHVQKQNPQVLEFASGFGRVGRFIRAKRPELDFTASDIHPAAIAFMKERLGIRAELSSFKPEQLKIAKGEFDFISVLSLFSHLPNSSFDRWLKALLSLLRSGGVLVFTTSGENSMEHQPHIAVNFNKRKGYGYFGNDSDQPDLATDVYGTMAVDFEYVVRQIRAASDDIIVSYERGAWHPQDVWILRRR
ncbi:class I SAM-dependent methyltransferase [Methylorubrum thiocyanatum]|uniref:class I SAM-dependent methyltransferase n=1 Tax=Methylorubrum thiocyanatum TaxID=47958 RepID=UPI00398C7EAE